MKRHAFVRPQSQTRVPFGVTLTAGGGWIQSPPKRAGQWRVGGAALVDLLRRSVFAEKELIEVAVTGNRGPDFARVDGFAPIDEGRDSSRLEKLGDDLGLGRFASLLFGRRVAPVRQHALDQAIDLRQGFSRRIDDQRLESLPLGLPLVQIKTWFVLGG